MPAFWQGITGGLEPGETYAQCALRELHEETGLSGYTPVDIGWTQHIPVNTGRNGKMTDGVNE